RIVMAVGIVAGRKQQRALAAPRQRPATDSAGGGQQPAQPEKGTALHHGNSSGNGWLWLIAFLLTCLLAFLLVRLPEVKVCHRGKSGLWGRLHAGKRNPPYTTASRLPPTAGINPAPQRGKMPSVCQGANR